MTPKKIIVPIILLLLLVGILFIRLGTHPQSSPAPASAPSVLTGAASSATAATTAQQTEKPSSTPRQMGATPVPIRCYTTDKRKPVKAKKDNKLKLPDKKEVVKFDNLTLYIPQKDGTVYEYDYDDGFIRDVYQVENWFYYIFESHTDFTYTLYRVPIDQQGEKTKMPKNQEQLQTDTHNIIYATDQYVICSTENNTIIKYTINSKKCECIDFSSDEPRSSFWTYVPDLNQKPIIGKNGDIYVKANTFDDDYIDSVCLYKINTDTFQKTKLSDRANAILSDPSGQIVIMESDETWNYAYYPETGKRFPCGQNMMKEWGVDNDRNHLTEDYDTEIVYLPSAANRDLVGWIQDKKPFGYRKKHGTFRCLNYFIYDDRMYVTVNLEWHDPKEDANDKNDEYRGEDANMLFSYSLKNYKGIRPETEINRIMKKYSSRTYESMGGEEEDELDSYYYKVTGNFQSLHQDILVLECDDCYVLYHLGTGAYRKIGVKEMFGS